MYVLGSISISVLEIDLYFNISMEESPIDANWVVDRACTVLCQKEKAELLIEYLKNEWIFTFEDLRLVIDRANVWASLRLPARLKVEMETIVRSTITAKFAESMLPTSLLYTLEGTIIDHYQHAKQREHSKVVIRVPATSANLGPGFDTIGMAIDMWSEYTVERSDHFQIISEGDGSEHMPLDETNLVCFGVAAAFKHAGKPLPVLRYHLNNKIPYARGLGSSSAAIVGGLLAGFVLAGHEVKVKGAEELLNIAANIEGHPDNVAPAIYGGIQLGIQSESRWMSERVRLPPGLQCVCYIPDVIGKTSIARGVLKDTVSRTDAVFNIGRVAWLVNALNQNNIDELHYGVEDSLHQPQRAEAVYPHLNPIMHAARIAGAKAVYLSGAGPTVMAWVSGLSAEPLTQCRNERLDRQVAQAMVDVANSCGLKGEVYVAAPVEKGAHIVSCVV